MLQVRAVAPEFRSRCSVDAWLKKMLRIFISLSVQFVGHNAQWNAFACMFACVTETWPISWRQSAMHEQMGLSVTTKTMVEFLKSNAAAFRAWKNVCVFHSEFQNLISSAHNCLCTCFCFLNSRQLRDDEYFPLTLMYDNVDFVRHGILEHGVLKLVAKSPVQFSPEFANLEPRLQPSEILPDLFIFNREDDKSLDELRAVISNRVRFLLCFFYFVCLIFINAFIHYR